MPKARRSKKNQKLQRKRKSERYSKPIFTSHAISRRAEHLAGVVETLTLLFRIEPRLDHHHSLAAHHLLGVEGLGEGRERGVVHAAAKAEQHVEGRRLNSTVTHTHTYTHIARAPSRRQSHAQVGGGGALRNEKKACERGGGHRQKT